jgi:hypothetical protein
MKNTLVLACLCASLCQAQSNVCSVTVHPDTVVVKDFLGFGVEWDSNAYLPYKLDDADFALIRSRVEWMRLPLARVMMISKWCYLGDGKFNFESPQMGWLYRQLDLCQAQNTRVLLTDWGCERDWLKYPGATKTDDPQYAAIIGAYMEHLVKVKGYTCIRHFIFGNEPNCELKDFDLWKRGLLNVQAEFKKRGLDKQVALTGTDHSGGDPWHTRAVSELGDVLGAYDVHRYTRVGELDSGSLQTYFAKAWQEARDKDPRADAKPMIVGEAGLFVKGFSAGNNPLNMEYSYGVQMPDYAVQAANAGSSGVSAWMLDDNSHVNFVWGLWKNKPDGMTLKPWFYTWSLLSRLVRPGARIVTITPVTPGVRMLAARMGDSDWTFCLVNRNADPLPIRLQIPQGPRLTLHRYLYSPASAKADAKGFPLALDRAEADLATGLDLPLPGNSVVFLTTLPE